MRTKTIILVIVLAAVAVGGLYGLKEYNREPEGAGSLVTKETIDAGELLKAFQEDEKAATGRFVGTVEQAIQVNGTIRAIAPAEGDKMNVVPETGDALAGVVCEFAKADVPQAWKAGSTVRVKGICTGMLLDVILVRCSSVE